MNTLSFLIGSPSAEMQAAVACILARYIPASVMEKCRDAGIHIYPLAPGQMYAEASAELQALKVDVDKWSTPPAGLFVVKERTVYLRSLSTMTVVHEFAHGFDCALGGGVYRSSIDPAIRHAFSEASEYVTPYAATGTDEYFAECFRAYCEANDTHSLRPRVSKERLRRVDPVMYAIIETLL